MNAALPATGITDPPSGLVPRAARPDRLYPMRRVRRECRRCGVHVVADVGYKVGGSCANCGSYELRPVDGA